MSAPPLESARPMMARAYPPAFHDGLAASSLASPREVVPLLLEMRNLLGDAYRALRSRLRAAPRLRSGWYLGIAVRDAIRDRWRRPETLHEEVFRDVDPWGYERPKERRRHEAALRLLDAVAPDQKWGCVMEVGCAEGHFTTLLAERAGDLLALDFVPIAVERTRARCAFLPQVRTGVCDLRRDELPGSFDLLVAMDVLSSIHRPAVIRRVRDKLVRAVLPGGTLLVGDVRQNEVWEESRWGWRFVRGAKAILQHFGRHPELVEIDRVVLDTHIYAVFQRTPAGFPPDPHRPDGRQSADA